MTRRRQTSASTLQIVAAVVVLLAVLVGMAFILAPRKPEAPPKSTVSYAPPPTAKPKPAEDDRDFEPLPPPRPEKPARDGAVSDGTVPAVDEASSGYTISGTVTRASDGSPLEKAKVAAYLLTAENPIARGGDWREGVDTDAGGAFRMAGLEAGSYRVVVTYEGLVRSETVTEAIGPEYPEAVIEVALHEGASIAGRVTVAGSSQGAADVAVRLEDVDAATRTDADGRYELSGLAPGEYGVTLNLRNTPYRAGKTLPFQKVTVKGADDRIINVDFQVESAGIVWGYVLTTNKEPVPNADVVLCTSDSPLSQMLSMAARQEAPVTGSTDESGYYELAGVPLNQTWRIYATANSTTPQLADPFLLTAAQNTVRIDIYMFAGSNVYGAVESSKGGLVEGADIMCIPSYSSLLSPMETPQAVRNSSSDAGGQFVLTQVPPGEYQLFARKKGFKISVTGFPIYPDGYTDLTNVRLTLNPVDDGEHTVFGIVLDGNGVGVDGAEVELTGASAEGLEAVERQETTSGGGRFQFAGVGSGIYSLQVRKDGFSPVTVRRVRLNEENKVVLRQTGTVRGVVLAKKSRQAPPSYSVEAYPLATEGGGRASFMGMMDNPSNSMNFSNPDGSFELRLDAGTYRLEAKSDGYAPARTEIQVQTGQVLEGVELLLNDEGARISGMVAAGDGGNVQGTTVTLIEAATPAEAMMLLGGSGGSATQQIGADGTFTFEDLPGAVYFVVASHPRYAAGVSEMIELSEGENRENIRIRLGFGGGLEGYVFREGQASAGAVVLVAGNGTTQSATTDQSGYYHMDGLTSGVYQAMVTEIAGGGDLSSIYGAQGVQVTVQEGQTTRHDFGSGAGARIEGQCMPGPANMLGGRAVLALPGSNPAPLGGEADLGQMMGQSTGINPMGSFVMEDVPPGEWQLDIYYLEFGVRNPVTVRYVHSQPLSVSGGEVIPLTIPVSNY